MLQDNSLQLEATIYHCVVQWMKMKLIRMLQNANFPNFRTTLKHKQSEFRKNDFIFVILAYSRSHTCLRFQISSSIKELEFPPGNNVSNKPLTPLDAHHSGDQFDINFMFVR